MGGVAWFAKVGMIWLSDGENTDSGAVWALDVAGWGLLAIALAAAGYTLVEKAPVWLRGVVAVADGAARADGVDPARPGRQGGLPG